MSVAFVSVNRLKDETGVEINIYESDESSIELQGSPEGVAKVKADLLDQISKLENEKEISVNVDIKVIRTWGKLREVRDAFRTVQFSIPPAG